MSHSAPHPSGPWARLGAALVRHARPVALVLLAAAAAAGIAAGLLLKVRPGYVDLLDPTSALQRRYLDLLGELGNVEALHVIIESEDATAAGAAADALAADIRALRDASGEPLASSVVSRIDKEALSDRAPAWLPARELERLAAWPELSGLVADPSPARLLGALRRGVATMANEDAVAAMASEASASGAASDAGASPEALAGLLEGLDAIAAGRAPATSASLLSASAEGSDLLDSEGRIQLQPGRLLITVMPVDTSNDAAILEVLVSGVRDAARGLNARSHAPVGVALTGAPALIVDEMSAVRRDVALASGLSFALVTLLFFVSFNSLRHVAFAVVANACGLALTFGAAYFLVGYLNLFSSVFAAVLAGLGIDFGIHFINFYEARRRDGLDAAAALVSSYASVVPPIAISAVTTAAAFLMIMSSEFAGFSQLGLISGVGVLLCLLTAFTLVPCLLAWSARSRPLHAAASRQPWSLPLLMLPVRSWRLVVPAGAVLMVLALGAALRLEFDHDLMNLQPAGTEAVELQRESEQRIGTHPAFSLAESVEEARARAAAFRALPSVASVRTPADALPPPDEGRPEALRLLSARLAEEAPQSHLAPIDLDATRLEAEALHAELLALQDLAFEGGRAQDVLALERPLLAAASLSASLAAPEAEARLHALRVDLAASAQRMTALLPELAERGVGPHDLPAGLRDLVGASGRIAVMVMPRESVWNRPALLGFLAEIRGVDADITGPAVQIAEITELMRVSLRRAALLAFAVIVILVLASTRSFRFTFLALFPLLCGFVMMLGLMEMLGVPLNPANLVALPLLLGIGVDGGMHLVHRWHATGDAARAIVDVGHALLITSLTTVAGFLPLMLAQHRGIRSLGAAACLGSLGMLLAVMILAPALLAGIDAWRSRRARSEASA